MGTITLKEISVQNTSVQYIFDVSDDLKIFFSDHPFIIEYPVSIESVPFSVLAIPFVSNVLPIVWVTDSQLILPELDKIFFDSIPEFKKGYINMYPNCSFKGKIIVDNVRPSDSANLSDRCALFFSGGVDSVDKFIRHIKENIDFISIWGSDFDYYNKRGWEQAQKAISQIADSFSVKAYVIHSSFRLFDREDILTNNYQKQLNDNWWHGVKHSIGLIGHAAPLAYLLGYSKIYIAASFCTTDQNVRCASYPTIDNFVRFSVCQVIHDGFECNRQEKIHNIVIYHNNNKEKYLPLHVCWETQTGENCCKCEKCYRTIAALIVEGADPADLGFKNYELYIDEMRNVALSRIAIHWPYIYKKANTNIVELKHHKDWKNIKWLLFLDFNNPSKYKQSLMFKLRHFSFRRIYNNLHHSLFLKKEFIKKLLKTWIYFRITAKPEFIVIGSPTHHTLGDSAITISQINFLNKINPAIDCVKELTMSEYNSNRDIYSKAISPKSVICGLGGGNMGNQWPEEELFRHKLIKDFPNNPIIIFPQTIFYLDNKNDGLREESIKLYNSHPNLTLVAREQKSFEIMKELYSNCKILLVPDIVLSSFKNDFGVTASERKGILLCLRSDAERKIKDSETDRIIEYLNNQKLDSRKTDMYSDCEVAKENRTECVRKKMQEFCGAKLVVTDRLHGMIFAAISETPAIVIGNYNHKVRGSFEWIKSLPYIKYADSVNEVLTEIPEMLKIQGCNYDNSVLSSHFDLLAEEVKVKCRKFQ